MQRSGTAYGVFNGVQVSVINVIRFVVQLKACDNGNICIVLLTDRLIIKKKHDDK